MTAKFGYVTTACRLCKDIVPPDDEIPLEDETIHVPIEEPVAENLSQMETNLLSTPIIPNTEIDISNVQEPVLDIDTELLQSLGDFEPEPVEWGDDLLAEVMICGAVPSKVRSVRLYSQCAHTYVNVFRNGTVMALSNGGDQSNLTISTRGYSLELLIYSPLQDMYLCFNRSRLVGRRISCYQAERQANCLFKEEFVEGYNRYYLVKNKDRYIGFNARGLQVRRGKSRLMKKQQKCLSFMTENNDFDINRHNKLRAGELTNRIDRRVHRRQRGPSPQNSIQPYHGLRHRERHQRRRNCVGT